MEFESIGKVLRQVNAVPDALKQASALSRRLDRSMGSEIRRLQNHHEWSEASELAVKRSNELDPTVELNEWVSRIEHL